MHSARSCGSYRCVFVAGTLQNKDKKNNDLKIKCFVKKEDNEESAEVKLLILSFSSEGQ